MVGHNLRFNKNLVKIKKMLNKEMIGRIISTRVHCGSYLPYRHPEENYRKGYGAREELGGGPILDSIHEIDYMLWFFGKIGSYLLILGN